MFAHVLWGQPTQVKVSQLVVLLPQCDIPQRVTEVSYRFDFLTITLLPIGPEGVNWCSLHPIHYTIHDQAEIQPDSKNYCTSEQSAQYGLRIAQCMPSFMQLNSRHIIFFVFIPDQKGGYQQKQGYQRGKYPFCFWYGPTNVITFSSLCGYLLITWITIAKLWVKQSCFGQVLSVFVYMLFSFSEEGLINLLISLLLKKCLLLFWSSH